MSIDIVKTLLMNVLLLHSLSKMIVIFGMRPNVFAMLLTAVVVILTVFLLLTISLIYLLRHEKLYASVSYDKLDIDDITDEIHNHLLAVGYSNDCIIAWQEVKGSYTTT
jgi:membrane protein YdbS with pleckstrin-like domain